MNDPATTAPIEGSRDVASMTEPETLAHYGIVREPTAVYHLGGFRYSTLADAVAQARRGLKSS